jgi:hypothetical protein
MNEFGLKLDQMHSLICVFLFSQFFYLEPNTKGLNKFLVAIFINLNLQIFYVITFGSYF